MLRLRGGGKKRKKKQYTKPKKIKHKHKKVKLAVLKYYKVDGNGKITRLRCASRPVAPSVCSLLPLTLAPDNPPPLLPRTHPTPIAARARRVCPNPECGPGVFMASHFDRQYCGKCGLTYMFDEKDKKPPPSGGGAAKAAAAPAEAAKGKGKKK